MVQDLGKLKDEAKDEAAQAEQNRKEIIRLGRYFEATIEDFISANGDVLGDVVMGACKYIMELYQERMVGYMMASSKKWGVLKTKIVAENLKLHEPFENDGLDSHVFNKGPQKPPMLPGGPQ